MCNQATCGRDDPTRYCENCRGGSSSLKRPRSGEFNSGRRLPGLPGVPGLPSGNRDNKKKFGNPNWANSSVKRSRESIIGSADETTNNSDESPEQSSSSPKSPSPSSPRLGEFNSSRKLPGLPGVPGLPSGNRDNKRKFGNPNWANSSVKRSRESIIGSADETTNNLDESPEQPSSSPKPPSPSSPHSPLGSSPSSLSGPFNNRKRGKEEEKDLESNSREDNFIYGDYPEDVIMKLLNYYHQNHSNMASAGVLEYVSGTYNRMLGGNCTELQTKLGEYLDNRRGGLVNLQATKVFIPVNINEDHWVAVCICYQNGGDVNEEPLVVYYFDSNSKNEINEQVEEVFHLFFSSQTLIMANNEQYQFHDNNCGPWIVEWFRALMNDNTWPDHVVNINRCRKGHMLVPEVSALMLQAHQEEIKRSSKLKKTSSPPQFGNNYFATSANSLKSYVLNDKIGGPTTPKQELFQKGVWYLRDDRMTVEVTEWAERYKTGVEELRLRSRFPQGYNRVIQNLDSIISHNTSPVNLQQLINEIVFIMFTDDLFLPPQRQRMPLTAIRLNISNENLYYTHQREYINELRRQLEIQLDGLSEYPLEQIFLRMDLYDFGSEGRGKQALSKLREIPDLEVQGYCHSILHKMKQRSIRLSQLSIPKTAHHKTMNSSMNLKRELESARTQIDELLSSNNLSIESLGESIINNEIFNSLVGRLEGYQPKWANSGSRESQRIRLGLVNNTLSEVGLMENSGTAPSVGLAALHPPDQSMGGKRRFPESPHEHVDYFGSGTVNTDIGDAWRGGSVEKVTKVEANTPHHQMRELRFKIHPLRWCNLDACFAFEVSINGQFLERLLARTPETGKFHRPSSRERYEKMYENFSKKSEQTISEMFYTNSLQEGDVKDKLKGPKEPTISNPLPSKPVGKKRKVEERDGKYIRFKITGKEVNKYNTKNQRIGECQNCRRFTSLTDDLCVRCRSQGNSTS